MWVQQTWYNCKPWGFPPMDAPQYPRSWIQVPRPNGSQFVGQSNAPQSACCNGNHEKKKYCMPMIFNCMWHMQLLDAVIAQDKLHTTGSYMYADNIYNMDLYFIHLYYSIGVAHGNMCHLNLISMFIIINKTIIFRSSNKMWINFWHVFIC